MLSSTSFCDCDVKVGDREVLWRYMGLNVFMVGCQFPCEVTGSAPAAAAVVLATLQRWSEMNYVCPTLLRALRKPSEHLGNLVVLRAYLSECTSESISQVVKLCNIIKTRFTWMTCYVSCWGQVGCTLGYGMKYNCWYSSLCSLGGSTGYRVLQNDGLQLLSACYIVVHNKLTKSLFWFTNHIWKGGNTYI